MDEIKESESVINEMKQHQKMDIVEKELAFIEFVRTFLPNLEEIRKKTKELAKSIGIESAKDTKKLIEGINQPKISSSQAISRPTKNKKAINQNFHDSDQTIARQFVKEVIEEIAKKN